jgi:hypothetical protein
MFGSKGPSMNTSSLIHSHICVQLYSLAATRHPLLPIPHQTRALLVNPDRRHLFVAPWCNSFTFDLLLGSRKLSQKKSCNHHVCNVFDFSCKCIFLLCRIVTAFTKEIKYYKRVYKNLYTYS